MIAYASRTGTKRTLEVLRRAGWHLLVSAVGALRNEGFPYALDNGAWSAYVNKRPFDEDAFLKALARLGSAAEWVVVPDIVAGGQASLDFSLRFMPRVLDATQLALLAVQDGITSENVREHLGDRVGLFVGGTTEWKLKTLPEWGRLAKSVGCWLHVGRVNSCRRISFCASVGADSFDGSGASKFANSVGVLERERRQSSLYLKV